MKRADELGGRLETLFKPPAGEEPRFLVVAGPGEVLVEETAKDGYAQIACRFGEGVRAIRWRLQTGDLRPIGSEKNADGAILVVRPDGALEAHVMECKSKVDSNTWRKALMQLEWTLIRLLAIAGALHERVERVVLYTVYRTDALSVDESADPELFRAPLEDEDNTIVARHLSWTKPEVALPGWSSRFPHVKVQKTDEGHAAVDLHVAT